MAPAAIHPRSSRGEAPAAAAVPAGSTAAPPVATGGNGSSLAAAAAAVSAASHGPAPPPEAAPAPLASQSCLQEPTPSMVCMTEGSPPREVSLHALHMRSQPLSVASRSLSLGLDSARRLDAFEWLVQAFDALTLPDAQLFAAFGLLDRFAAASPAPISAGPGAFALVLAAMLVALKVSGTQRDLDRAKRLVVEVSGSSRPWAAVRRAELSILRRLHFRACTPTTRELLDRVLNDAAVRLGDKDLGAWDVEARERVALLARFLLELGVVHEPETVYGNGRPPLAVALAAALLALLAMNAPRMCYEAIEESLAVLESPEASVTEVAEAMRQRWSTEERRTLGGQNSPVLEKWMRRAGGTSLPAPPPHAGDLRYLLVGNHGPTVSPCFGLSAAEFAAPRKSQAEAASSQQPALTQPTPRAVLAPTHVVAQQQVQHPQMSAGGPNAATAGKISSAQLASQLARTTATENMSSWPVGVTAPSAGIGPGGLAPEPQPQSPRGLQTARAAGGPAKVQLSTGSAATVAACGSSHAGDQRSPEAPLVELTQVLNMVVPRVLQAPGGARPEQTNSAAAGGGNGAAKPRPPSVAAELLVSSALRMQWPVDRRKVACADAASSCREAAAVLQEATSQLLAAATTLDNGFLPARDVKAQCSESKRRRTFGGPSPVRAVSPGDYPARGGGPLAPRGSPPQVRLAGLRV